MHESIHAFLNGQTFAVAGASTNQAKFGNQVFRALVKSGRTTFPLNPTASEVEGQIAYSTLSDLPEAVDCLAIITPPQITQQVVVQAIDCGVKHLWIQPGAQHAEASRAALNAGLTVVDDGACLLIVLEDEI
ncbi:MAG: CoA-binding protein [Fuerstiella sp.]